MITNQIHHFKNFYSITDSDFYVMCSVSRGYRISQTSPSPPVFISFLGFQNIYVGCICTSKIVDTRPDLSCSRGGAPLPAPHHSPITHRSTPLLHALRSRDRHESLLQLRFPSSSQSLFVIFFFFFFFLLRDVLFLLLGVSGLEMVRGVGFCGISQLNCAGVVRFGGDLCVV